MVFFAQFSFVYSWEQGFTHLILTKILIKRILIGQYRCIASMNTVEKNISVTKVYSNFGSYILPGETSV